MKYTNILMLWIVVSAALLIFTRNKDMPKSWKRVILANLILSPLFFILFFFDIWFLLTNVNKKASDSANQGYKKIVVKQQQREREVQKAITDPAERWDAAYFQIHDRISWDFRNKRGEPVYRNLGEYYSNKLYPEWFDLYGKYQELPSAYHKPIADIPGPRVSECIYQALLTMRRRYETERIRFDCENANYFQIKEIDARHQIVKMLEFPVHEFDTILADIDEDMRSMGSFDAFTRVQDRCERRFTMFYERFQKLPAGTIKTL